MEAIGMNLQNNKNKFDDKVNDLNKKARQRDAKIKDTGAQRELKSMKNQEVEHLRFLDTCQAQDQLKAKRFNDNCMIVEKHLALSMMNQERKQFLNSFNDRYRSKMAKERLNQRNQHGELTPFVEATKKHMTLGTYAPDLVKWTKRDIEKLLKEEDKKDD